MNSLVASLIGPVIDGVKDLFIDKQAVVENVKTKTGAAGASLAAGTTALIINTDQTIEQITIGIVGYLVSAALIICKERKKGR